VTRNLSRVWTALCLTIAASAFAGGKPRVNESARQIPVAYNVDVVVVGGGTGAVSAAVAAAEAGAKVFLAAPRPYLGDDMTATLRLWLEPGESPTTPLAKRIFGDDQRAMMGPDPRRIPFTYSATLPTGGVHKDTNPPSCLTDGAWGSASRASVQYDGDVAVTADLGKVAQISGVRVYLFERTSGKGGSNFIVDTIAVSASDDAKVWKPVATMQNKQFERKAEQGVGNVIEAWMPVAAKTRFVKLAFKRGGDAPRILLGEIEIVGKAAPKPSAKAAFPPPRPMHVKKTLDEALLEANVAFLYGCYPTDVLRDAQGQPCGIVMANRAGRQAVVAKTIVDCTPRAVVARMAGGRFRPYPGGRHTFKRVVIGGTPREGAGLTARVIEPPFRGAFPNPARTSSGEFHIIEYTLSLPMRDATYASFARADQQARTLTYHPEQQFTSDWLFEVPPDPMHGQAQASGAWQGAEAVALGALRPAGVSRLLVLGGCADIPRAQADKLLRPVALMELGMRVGAEAAREAKALAAPAGVKLPGKKATTPVSDGDVGEFLVGVRPTQSLPKITQDARALPVLGRYDVVVIGGGTAGAPAGIAAARRGAKTLVVEYLYGLGGVGTLGAISRYCAGNRIGFTATVPTMDNKGRGWVIEKRMEWWRTEVLKAGGDIWFGTCGCGAWVKDKQVRGAVVVTPFGRGVVLGTTVIDCTGNADVAAAAGAETTYTDHTEMAMQGTGLPPRDLGRTYTNTDFTIADDTDMLDVTHLFVYGKNKYPNAFDQGQLIDTRERRAIVGESTMTILDQLNRRTYPDTIAEARGGGYDTHGYTVDPLFLITHPRTGGVRINTSYRCLLPKGFDGLLVAGIGASYHRDAQPLLRMQPDIQNQGYAAGAAAAMAAASNGQLRAIDMRALQRHLIDIGNLPKAVLTQKDSYPLSDKTIADAVASLGRKRQIFAPILTHPKRALPLLRKAYAAAKGAHKLTCAFVLATLGDPTGLDTLLAAVEATPKLDKGWNYKGMGQFGHNLSPLDRQIVALARTRQRRVLPAILKKLELLTAESEFSHHRAVGLACEMLADPAAARPLAALLAKKGMTGYVHASVADSQRLGVPGGVCAVGPRRESIRELLLARALYRCGDHNGLGARILRAYTADLRGHFARHAKAVLEAASK